MYNIQKRRTREVMFPVVESWQVSGLNKTAFCKERGIIKSVFFIGARGTRKKIIREVPSQSVFAVDPSGPASGKFVL